jgi:glycosyltransferase involved in cell wall biosynthesis
MVKVTIGIKAFNEEAKIAACLASALDALEGCDGEVVLADCRSRDRTVELAKAYPVRIVQLLHDQDRGCGAGAQLAFQHARGEFFYMLDGDMILDPDFIRAGVAYLEEHPVFSGVGGHVIEQNLEGEEFQVRADKEKAFAGRVDHLYCGGLYRSEAIRSVGYFADPNLHAFEEFELGARLAADGWQLARIDRPGVRHFGHTESGLRLILRRLRSGYSDGLGEVLRGALGRPHLRVVLARLRTLQMACVVVAWWMLLLACLVARQGWALLALAVAPMAYFVLRRRSFRLALYSYATCNMFAIGLVRGVFRARRSPAEPLPSCEIDEAQESSGWQRIARDAAVSTGAQR